MVSNIATYTPSEKRIHSLKPLTAMVEVEGLPVPWLELLEVIRRPGPELNEARLRLLGHLTGPKARFESVGQLARPGQRIRAWLIGREDSVTGNQSRWPLFAGVIAKGAASLSGSGEGIEIVAVDELAYRQRRVIDGIRVPGDEGRTVYIQNDQAVFNPDGKGNCTKIEYTTGGISYRVFELNEKSGCDWTYAEAICYLICEYLGRRVISASCRDELKALTEGQHLRDIDVSGLTPLEGLERLCREAGLRYRVEHVPAGESEIKEVLQFYRLGQGRVIGLRHQKAGEDLDLDQTNLVGSQLQLDRAGATCQIKAQGGIKRFESTFDLVEGWDQSLEINDYSLYSPATNENFERYRDVFRKWVLNEAGDYTSEPYNQGAAYELCEVFGTKNYARRRRRFYPCLSRNQMGEPIGSVSGVLGYYLEVSYNDGESWQPYGGAFNVLKDEGGIYLSGEQLEPQVWVAICKGVLRFRITCSLDSDERLEAVVSDGPVKSARPVRTKVIDLGDEYQYREVTKGSIFAGDTFAKGPADVVDDTEKLRGHAREELKRERRRSLGGKAELIFVRPDIQVGDVMRQVKGREVNLSRLSSPGEGDPQVDKVRIRLGNKWATMIEYMGVWV